MIDVVMQLPITQLIFSLILCGYIFVMAVSAFRQMGASPIQAIIVGAFFALGPAIASIAWYASPEFRAFWEVANK
jgi:hypothetical protein